MERLVIFVRHGESTKNAANLFTSAPQGWPLTEKGRAMADAAGSQLVKLPRIDKLYTTNVLRGRQTAGIISRYIRLKPIVTSLLRERSPGRYENKKYKSFEDISRVLKYEIENDYPNWESLRSMAHRIERFVAKLEAGTITVAVSHGDPIKAAIGYAKNDYNERNLPDAPKHITPGSMTAIDFHPQGKSRVLFVGAMSIPARIL